MQGNQDTWQLLFKGTDLKEENYNELYGCKSPTKNKDIWDN